MMDIRLAARLLGGNIVRRDTVCCPGPGHSRNDRSLTVTFHDRDFLVHSFSNDDWPLCRDHVRAVLGLGSFQPSERQPAYPATHVTVTAEPEPGAAKRRDFALSLWSDAKTIGGTIAEHYLAGRGILIPDVALTGLSLRFHPACPFRLENGEAVRLPAMLGAMIGIEDNQFQGVHRTALADDGSGKAKVRGLSDPKKMLGSSHLACVKLCPDEDVTSGLAICEGIETGLAIIGNFGFRPVWAALSASTVANFPILSGVESLTVFADNDKPKLQGGRYRQAGNEAAQTCTSRWTEAGHEAAIWLPPEIGSDFNDIAERPAA